MTYYRYVVTKDIEPQFGIFRVKNFGSRGFMFKHEYRELMNMALEWLPIKPYELHRVRTESYFTAEGSKKAQPMIRQMRSFWRKRGMNVIRIRKSISDKDILYSDKYQVFIKVA